MLVLMEKCDIKTRSVQARDVAKWGPYIYSLQKKKLEFDTSVHGK